MDFKTTDKSENDQALVARKLPLELIGVGIDHLQEPLERPTGLEIHTWIQSVQGEGEVSLEQGRSVAGQSSGILMLKETPYALKASEPGWTTHYVTFSGSVCDSILIGLGLTCSGVYHITNPAVLARHIKQMDRILRTAPDDMHREASKALYALLLDLSVGIRYLRASMPAIRNEKLQGVIRFVEEHFSEPIQLEQLAELAGLRKEYLCTLFKRQMGQTIFEFILSLRIARARVYLVQHPSLTVKAISQMCGFDSPSYFGRVFRQFENMTPQQYRQTH